MTDISSRVVAQKLSVEFGQPVVVENRAGASGVIGAEIGAKAAADGYTLTMGNISTLAINAVTFAKLPYDPIASFAPVSMVAIQPLVIAVHPSVPAQTLAELVALARAQPGKLNFGTAGSSIYLAVEFFNSAAGIKMNHVPYKGSSPAITDLVGGQIQVLFDPFSSLYPQVRSGKARGLAVTTLKRSSMAPALPTVAELGYPGFDVSSWQGIVVPAARPRDRRAAQPGAGQGPRLPGRKGPVRATKRRGFPFDARAVRRLYPAGDCALAESRARCGVKPE